MNENSRQNNRDTKKKLLHQLSIKTSECLNKSIKNAKRNIGNFQSRSDNFSLIAFMVNMFIISLVFGIPIGYYRFFYLKNYLPVLPAQKPGRESNSERSIFQNNDSPRVSDSLQTANAQKRDDPQLEVKDVDVIDARVISF